MALKFPDKDPDEQLDYSVDWSRYLAGSTLSTVTWKIEDTDGTKNTWTDTEIVDGLQRVSASNTTSVATIQISLGTVNKTYKIYCAVTTSSGNATERKILLKVRER
jgi:hypothetical protein